MSSVELWMEEVTSRIIEVTRKRVTEANCALQGSNHGRICTFADERISIGKAIPHLCDRQLFLTRFCGRVILSGLVLICPITPPFFFSISDMWDRLHYLYFELRADIFSLIAAQFHRSAFSISSCPGTTILGFLPNRFYPAPIDFVWSIPHLYFCLCLWLD